MLGREVRLALLCSAATSLGWPRLPAWPRRTIQLHFQKAAGSVRVAMGPCPWNSSATSVQTAGVRSITRNSFWKSYPVREQVPQLIGLSSADERKEKRKFLDLHMNMPLWSTASFEKQMLILRLFLSAWLLSMQISPVLPLSNTK